MEVYLITNKINEKGYVGITGKTSKIRFKKHIQDAKAGSNFLIHQAIRKYGSNNFSIRVIDTAKDLKEAKEKEIFYIKKYSTFWELGFGYNMTRGGDSAEKGEKHPTSKMSDLEVRQVIQLLEETDLTFNEIIKKLELKVQERQIGYINSGEQRFFKEINYPIRKNPRSHAKVGILNPSAKLSEKDVFDIIELLKNTKTTQKKIAEQYGVHYNTISYINTCRI